MISHGLVILVASTCFVQSGVAQDGVELPLRNFAKRFCIECHEGAQARADLDLTVVLDRLDAGEHPGSLSSIIERIVDGSMPPEDELQPDDDQRAQAIALLESLHDDTSAQHPLRPTARRLSRHEYANSVCDLLLIDRRVEDELPLDEIANGFDNSGDVLAVPPLLLEKYFDLAESLALEALPTPGSSAARDRHFEGEELHQSGPARGGLRGVSWTLATNGAIVRSLDLSSAGRYVLRAQVRGQQAGDEPVRMGLVVDGEVVFERSFDSPRDVPETLTAEVTLAAGRHVVGAAFLNDYYRPEAPDPAQRDRNAFVDWIELDGPIRQAFPSRLQKQLLKRFRSVDRRSGRVGMIRELASRAWRQRVSNEQLKSVFAVADRQDNDDTWAPVRTALTMLLVHPRFLFRVEREPPPGAASRTLDGMELATRLSYFLWSTMPDEHLRSVALRGGLRTPAGRAHEVQRMLKDDRATALGEHFATQWLHIRTLEDQLPDAEIFREVDEKLLVLMRRETVLLFNEIVRTNSPIDRLLDADWTFLNERLAEHYGIAGIRGDDMQKVALATDGGTGVLRHASVLLATSTPSRTSPVKRGKWVLEALLDQAPPPAPANVAALPGPGESNAAKSMRERTIAHRTNPECAACHVIMDPLGFALEGFDAVGRERDTHNGLPIDNAAVLPDGTAFEGAIGLRDVLLSEVRRARFYRSVVRHMMTYALGRGLGPSDDAMIDALTKTLETTPTFENLILELVETDVFLLRPTALNAMIKAVEPEPTT